MSQAIGGAVPSPPLRRPTCADAVTRLYRRCCRSCDMPLTVVSCVREHFEDVGHTCALVSRGTVGRREMKG